MKDYFDYYLDSDLISEKSWLNSVLYTIKWYNNLSEEFLNEHEKLHKLFRKIIDNKSNKTLFNIEHKDNSNET